MRGTAPGTAVRSRHRMTRLLWQFARFLIVGLASFAIDYGLYVLLFQVLGVHYLVASTISFSVSLIVNYILTLKFVFDARAERRIVREFLAYIGLNIIALGLNQLILYLAVDVFGASPFVGKLIATAIVLVYNFISRKLLIERAGAPVEPAPAPAPPNAEGIL